MARSTPPAPDAGTGEQGQPIVIDVLASDTPSQNADGTPGAWDSSTLHLLDGAGNPVDNVDRAG